jgi:hypothetical protein
LKAKAWNTFYFSLFKKEKTGLWWLTSVILATQEAEIRRITVQN